MKEITIQRYEPAMKPLWNDFVAASRNATFLFDRAYMDYHADRFADHSLVARKGNRVIAMLPADITADGTLHSHRGLTYGGWILPPCHFDCADMLALWQTLRVYCRDTGISAIDYKPLPAIYATAPSGEDIYALFRNGARMTECNISAAIYLQANPGFNQLRRRNLRQAAATGCHVGPIDPATGIDLFHAMLSDCLDSRHGAAPVHTSAELRMLASRFPDNIRLWGVTDGSCLDAACLLFVTSRVVHCQYIASTPAGRDNNLLTLLFDRLIHEAAAGTFGSGIRYFDFGTSNEDHGRVLNEGLYRQKASMGGSGVPYMRFTLDL